MLSLYVPDDDSIECSGQENLLVAKNCFRGAGPRSHPPHQGMPTCAREHGHTKSPGHIDQEYGVYIGSDHFANDNNTENAAGKDERLV